MLPIALTEWLAKDDNRFSGRVPYRFAVTSSGPLFFGLACGAGFIKQPELGVKCRLDHLGI
jgi:hypothetical protein